MATPTALMMSSARGVKSGILFRSGESIQTLKDVKTIVFDKTGTITKGKPEVTDIIVLNNLTEDNLLQLTASLEQGSEHFLAQSILDKAKMRKLSLFEPHNFSSLHGMGITGEVNNKYILIGNQLCFSEKNITIPAEIGKQISLLYNILISFNVKSESF